MKGVINVDLYKMTHVNKIYHNYDSNLHALKDVNLSIPKGEIVVILGPSGSGKSTLLNILSGIDYPTDGNVLFDGKNIEHYRDDELTEYRRNSLGFIFQSYNLIANLTVKENIELGSHLSEDPFPMDDVIQTVGLEDHKNKYPYQLSGGQMQRVSIARALVKNPKVLFCDEPTGALDEKTGKDVLASLQEVNQKYHTTMIIVTHNPSIADMANTVIRMNSGEIVEVRKNKKVKQAEDLRWA
ncbi:MAG: ABC transporter ATP-binding protein [Firmicutes bacterium]|nr:ABC transporter ATP-binding protein [Bacillota bacterium]